MCRRDGISYRRLLRMDGWMGGHLGVGVQETTDVGWMDEWMDGWMGAPPWVRHRKQEQAQPAPSLPPPDRSMPLEARYPSLRRRPPLFRSLCRLSTSTDLPVYSQTPDKQDSHGCRDVKSENNEAPHGYSELMGCLELQHFSDTAHTSPGTSAGRRDGVSCRRECNVASCPSTSSRPPSWVPPCGPAPMCSRCAVMAGLPPIPPASFAHMEGAYYRGRRHAIPLDCL